MAEGRRFFQLNPSGTRWGPSPPALCSPASLQAAALAPGAWPHSTSQCAGLTPYPGRKRGTRRSPGTGSVASAPQSTPRHRGHSTRQKGPHPQTPTPSYPNKGRPRGQPGWGVHQGCGRRPGPGDDSPAPGQRPGCAGLPTAPTGAPQHGLEASGPRGRHRVLAGSSSGSVPLRAVRARTASTLTCPVPAPESMARAPTRAPRRPQGRQLPTASRVCPRGPGLVSGDKRDVQSAKTAVPGRSLRTRPVRRRGGTGAGPTLPDGTDLACSARAPVSRR